MSAVKNRFAISPGWTDVARVSYAQSPVVHGVERNRHIQWGDAAISFMHPPKTKPKNCPPVDTAKVTLEKDSVQFGFVSRSRGTPDGRSRAVGNELATASQRKRAQPTNGEFLRNTDSWRATAEKQKKRNEGLPESQGLPKPPEKRLSMSRSVPRLGLRTPSKPGLSVVPNLACASSTLLPGRSQAQESGARRSNLVLKRGEVAQGPMVCDYNANCAAYVRQSLNRVRMDGMGAAFAPPTRSTLGAMVQLQPEYAPDTLNGTPSTDATYMEKEDAQTRQLTKDAAKTSLPGARDVGNCPSEAHSRALEQMQDMLRTYTRQRAASGVSDRISDVRSDVNGAGGCAASRPVMPAPENLVEVHAQGPRVGKYSFLGRMVATLPENVARGSMPDAIMECNFWVLGGEGDNTLPPAEQNGSVASQRAPAFPLDVLKGSDNLLPCERNDNHTAPAKLAPSAMSSPPAYPPSPRGVLDGDTMALWRPPPSKTTPSPARATREVSDVSASSRTAQEALGEMSVSSSSSDSHRYAVGENAQSIRVRGRHLAWSSQEVPALELTRTPGTEERSIPIPNRNFMLSCEVMGNSSGGDSDQSVPIRGLGVGYRRNIESPPW